MLGTLTLLPMTHPTRPDDSSTPACRYFANLAVLCSPASFFYTAVTYVVGYELKKKRQGCEHNFTATGREDCSMGAGQIPGGTLGNWSWCKTKTPCAYDHIHLISIARRRTFLGARAHVHILGFEFGGKGLGVRILGFGGTG